MGRGKLKWVILVSKYRGVAYIESSFNVTQRYAEPSFNVPPGTLKLVSTYPRGYSETRGGNLKLGSF